jgi:N-acetylmuramic acid 6-phosphate etherase
MFEAVEGAEDDRNKGAADLRLLYPTYNDVILLVAASGTTPYVLGALQAARTVGSLTWASPTTRHALLTGPTSASAGHRPGTDLRQHAAQGRHGAENRAQHLVHRPDGALHKTYRNLMVDLHATNAKLKERAVRLTMHATGADATPRRRQCQHQVKVAIVMLLKKQTAAEAQAQLDLHTGNIRAH